MIEDSLYTVGSAHYDEDSSSELLESSSNASNLASSGMLSWSLQLGVKDSKKGVID